MTLIIIAICSLLASRVKTKFPFFPLIISIIFGIYVISAVEFFLDGGRDFISVVKFYKFEIVFSFDKVGIAFLCLISMLWPPAMIYCKAYENVHKVQNSLFYINLSVFFTILIALSGNLFTNFVCYELLTLSTLPLIPQSSRQQYAIRLLIPSILMFLPMVVYDQKLSGIMLAICILGIAKSTIFPMHSWIIYAMSAPFSVSGILHGVAVVKAGFMTCARLSEYNQQLLILSFCGLTYAGVKAALEQNVKNMLAYSTIANLNLGLIGVFSSNLDAAIMYMISHGVAKMTLFFIFGINAQYDIQKQNLSKASYAMLIINLSSLIGIPPLIGFFTKYELLYSGFKICGDVFSIVILAGFFSMAYAAKIFKHITYKKQIVDFSKILMELSCIYTTTILIFFPYNFLLKILK